MRADEGLGPRAGDRHRERQFLLSELGGTDSVSSLMVTAGLSGSVVSQD